MMSTTLLQLMWVHRAEAGRFRRTPTFRDIAPIDRADLPVVPGMRFDPDDLARVLAVLQVAPRTPTWELRAAERSDGFIVPLLAVVDADMTVAFAPVERLRATIAAALPFAGSDSALRSAIDAAEVLLALPHLVTAAETLESHSARISGAFARTPRDLPPDHLQTMAQRALLEHRHYERRPMFGGPHLRLELSSRDRPSSGVRGGIDASAAGHLPIASRFSARAIVEVHRDLERDGGGVVARVLAVARAVATTK